MPSFKSKYAYPILYYILSHRQFTQRQMSRDLEIKHGGSISVFINWLEELEFIQKYLSPIDKVKAYRVSAPVALVKFFSNFRKMSDLRISLDMGDNRNAAMEYFKKMDGVFCLTTALEFYTEYVRDPAIHVYVDKNYWNEMIEKESEGTVRINLYSFRPYRSDNITEIKGTKITNKLRTFIDLFCDDKAYAAEPLMKQIWT